ncbi:hypothetical protein A3K86_22110 [Photobacterium jeanii]|uniref:Uncharacterized protein n=1 Tax=Photobacterium jeanii TaxID=858640 RepID=A0A178K4H0_9GAMM|nr:hypothetical protein A3K86_22110 [Photobacterium jeanii]PST91133.1 hypothetical protein C9I91_11215 [Photobacterium jeanii]
MIYSFEVLISDKFNRDDESLAISLICDYGFKDIIVKACNDGIHVQFLKKSSLYKDAVSRAVEQLNLVEGLTCMMVNETR